MAFIYPTNKPGGLAEFIIAYQLPNLMTIGLLLLKPNILYRCG